VAEAGLDVKQLLTPLLISSVLKGEEINIDAIIDLYVNEIIVTNMLKTIKLPEEFAELQDVIKLMLEVQRMKAVSAILRGETPEVDIGKVFDILVSLHLVSAIAGAFGGEAGGEAK